MAQLMTVVLFATVFGDSGFEHSVRFPRVVTQKRSVFSTLVFNIQFERDAFASSVLFGLHGYFRMAGTTKLARLCQPRRCPTMFVLLQRSRQSRSQQRRRRFAVCTSKQVLARLARIVAPTNRCLGGGATQVGLCSVLSVR